MNLYSLLSEETIEWEKVKIGLVDERFVPKENLFNNETQIKNNLLKNSAKFATIFGMVYNYENEMLNLKMVNQQYKTFFERIDFTILGMGEDGHTASLFPGDKESEELMNTSNIGIFSTKSPINNPGTILSQIPKHKTPSNMLCDKPIAVERLITSLLNKDNSIPA